MMDWNITDNEIEVVEKMLLPENCHFADDAKEVIRHWKSTDVSACPGSGKTTVLLAKLKLIADRMSLLMKFSQSYRNMPIKLQVIQILLEQFNLSSISSSLFLI